MSTTLASHGDSLGRYQWILVLSWALLGALTISLSQGTVAATELRGRIVDADSKQLIPARLYIRSANGDWHFAKSASNEGSAVEYRKQRGKESVEFHTTLSAHPFVVDLPEGDYTVIAERGKEYVAARREIQLGGAAEELELGLDRWINMARHGWYSGDTHVHRGLDELPNVMLAEDLNVALPLTYWVTHANTPPSQGDKNSAPPKTDLIEVDAEHVIYPLNTEYEIFTVGTKRHTLGAVFALNHRNLLRQGVPPVGPVAEQVHKEGGLLELDKHNWPWSMMLVPIMNVDLYELTNNHIWRTAFEFRGYSEPPAEYMKIETDERGWTERGWIHFTLENYYALLDCGFRMRPTAGTASGVHPVPLGFGRVYVHLPDGFSYAAWMQGLDEGRSFVTTGPMLDVRVNQELPGTEFRPHESDNRFRVTGWARSDRPLKQLEIIVNGESHWVELPTSESLASGGFEARIDQTIELDGSGWLAVRCFAETPEGRIRYAHTAPWHVVAKEPLRPRREEVDYLIKRVTDQISRNEEVLSAAAMSEYRQALDFYRSLRPTARGSQ